MVGIDGVTTPHDYTPGCGGDMQRHTALDCTLRYPTALHCLHVGWLVPHCHLGVAATALALRYGGAHPCPDTLTTDCLPLHAFYCTTHCARFYHTAVPPPLGSSLLRLCTALLLPLACTCHYCLPPRMPPAFAATRTYAPPAYTTLPFTGFRCTTLRYAGGVTHCVTVAHYPDCHTFPVTWIDWCAFITRTHLFL